jgi:hypothetical protein
VTGTQLLVLALLGAAFVAGWVAGRNGDERLELRLPRTDLLRMLDEAATAAQAALSTRASTDLERLEDAKQALAQALGSDHPLVDDLEQLSGALALAAVQSDDADAAIASAVESAARTAATRFNRTAAAIRTLEPDRRQRPFRSRRLLARSDSEPPPASPTSR